jgi:hypothetical protein
MSDKIPPVGRDRPFPWTCFECNAQEVFPQATDYTTTRKHDGRAYTIRIPDLAIPTCRKCGDQTFSVGDDNRIIAALRAQIGLLTSEEMQKGRGQLQMTQEELAAAVLWVRGSAPAATQAVCPRPADARQPHSVPSHSG